MSEKELENQTDIEPIISFTKEDIEDNKPHVLTTIISPSGKEIAITNDVDQAMKLALEHKGETIELDSVQADKLLRKIDLYLLPVMCLLYCFQFMDKLTTSYASVLGLRKELKCKVTCIVGRLLHFTWDILSLNSQPQCFCNDSPLLKQCQFSLFFGDDIGFAFCSPIPRVCCLENYFGNVGTECDTRLHYYHISMVQKGGTIP